MGANLSLLSVIRNLRVKFNYEPIVLLPQNGSMCEVLNNEEIEYFIQPFYWWVMTSNCYDFKHYLDNLNKQRRNYNRIKKFTKDNLLNKDITLVYSNSVTINIGVLIAKLLHVNHVWHFREDLSQFNFVIPPLTGYLSFHNRYTKRYICISDFQAKGFKNYIPTKKLIRIYNGVDAPSSITEHQQQLRKEINLCCVGAISEQKNQMDIVRAVNILLKKDIPVRLHLIGPEDDSYKDKLCTYIEEKHINENVVFHGMCNDIFEMLAKMSIAVMPSRDEAFGRVTIEYMLMGLPIVASNSGANPELIKDGRNGLLYSIYDPHNLANCIERLILDSTFMGQCHDNNLTDAQKFSEEANISMIYKVFSDVE